MGYVRMMWGFRSVEKKFFQVFSATNQARCFKNEIFVIRDACKLISDDARFAERVRIHFKVFGQAAPSPFCQVVSKASDKRICMDIGGKPRQIFVVAYRNGFERILEKMPDSIIFQIENFCVAGADF